jgi:hypothetical protein
VASSRNPMNWEPRSMRFFIRGYQETKSGKNSQRKANTTRLKYWQKEDNRKAKQKIKLGKTKGTYIVQEGSRRIPRDKFTSVASPSSCFLRHRCSGAGCWSRRFYVLLRGRRRFRSSAVFFRKNHGFGCAHRSRAMNHGFLLFFLFRAVNIEI